ncbi:unannotated protein [freshwater metagenome]|uniref:Unannotated protein n=1 Tax=freshwater metagenome TaxID=449393 RepID=A0A6J7C267_9ZZZZ
MRARMIPRTSRATPWRGAWPLASLAAGSVACAALVTGCSSGLSVPIPQPEPTGVAAYTCAALLGRLPDEVLHHNTTPTNPLSSFTSAWGDPAIVLRCGVSTPQALKPTSELITVDGIDWLPEKLTHGYRFTTVGRVLNVEVSVPDKDAPESGALVDLSPAVTLTVPAATTPSPSPSP